MTKKKIIISLALVTVISVGIFWAIGKPVKTEEEAIEIAKTYILKKYGNRFDDYVIKAYDESEIWVDPGIWVVLYSPKELYDEFGTQIKWTLDGEGPSIHIKKSNGRVIYCDFRE